MATLRKIWESFFAWYERHLALNVALTAGLFAFQIVHLLWLSHDIALHRLFGVLPWFSDGLPLIILSLVDYTEVPALILTSIYYIRNLRQGGSFKDWLYLFFLNTQWIHMFWITDEVVFHALHIGDSQWNPFLAAFAIAIDYLELPVMAETINEARKALLRRVAA
jgi:hypothetical protein